MSLVDVGKALHRRATDLFCGPPIVFIHVPKCGGTSVGRALRRAYMLSQDTVKPHESAQAFDAAQRGPSKGPGDVSQLREMMLLYLLYCETRCVAAHVPFSDRAFEIFGSRYAFVTMLRDPVERLLSNYYWKHRPQRQPRAPEALADFLQTDRAQQAGSTYVRYFCGDAAQEKRAAKQVDAAIRNIRRLNCVGFLDDVASFEAGLRELTGRRIKLGRENVGRMRPSDPSSLHGPLREKAVAACARDREIWDAIQDLRDASDNCHPPSEPGSDEAEKSGDG